MSTTLRIHGELKESTDSKVIQLKTNHFVYTSYINDINENEPVKPEELLLTSLISSTLHSLHLYIKANHWNDIRIGIEALLQIKGNGYFIHQNLIIDECTELEEEQLLFIARNSALQAMATSHVEIITTVS